ncbi:hypothetical protein [Streptomyces purpurogeneiscleroticus]|uniref:hypothetical protein n=1 Tax=Streptomyces purpurogeneiscleroticus TaxID=68259 RepID=UPI001CBDE606|nr:hypothetical protein [Streptomyces purpurogeneiscleroticus]MBZ4020400.1 hypothetical protein [Streptomyces purpurogeneiscleroticus]
MDTGITIAVILAMIVLGALLIHRLNDQQTGRIAAHPHGHRLHWHRASEGHRVLPRHRGLPGHRGRHGSAEPPPPGSHS